MVALKLLKSGRSLLILLLAFALLQTRPALATNGYFRHGYGIQHRAMAGAGAALSLTPLSVATNPAALVGMGKRLDISFGLFNPNREYTVSGNPSGFPGTFPLAPGTVESDSRVFALPSIGLSLEWAGYAIGFAIYGNGGMNTNYPTKTFNNPQIDFNPPTGVDLAQAFFAVTVAREFAPGHSLGVTGIFAFQRFKAEGLFAFSPFSLEPNHLTNNGHTNSTGFGARFGYLGKFGDVLSIGAAFQTKIYMSEFDDYAGLFAEHGDFDIPANWVAGIALKLNDYITLAGDVQEVFYSDIASVGNPMNPAFGNCFGTVQSTGNADSDQNCLGGDQGPGFAWNDMTTVKIGLQIKASESLTVRAGASHGEQPIPTSDVLFNILAPGVIEDHITAGFSQKLSPKLTLNVAAMHAFSHSVVGDNPLEAPGQQQIKLKMNQYEGEVGLSINL
ncbi:MAG: hypothetical protein D6715_05330 [Calditrichaeota bacterium]|nr:MAG: hypothetical protein D6715_05330 [Calditrichota bacterium]